MQYRLSTLLLAFVVVWASLAVFGAVGGIVVAAILLVIAAFVRSPELRKHLATSCSSSTLWALPGRTAAASGFRPFTKSARRTTCQNNLKQIGLALRNYETANGRLPPAVVADKQGKAMHSWRTLILPYLECATLYNAYSFREPWNGPNNSKLAAVVLAFFCCPVRSVDQGSPDDELRGRHRPRDRMGRSSFHGEPPRVMVVEVANSNINWMEPRDLTLEEACRGVGDGSGPGISSHHVISGGFFFQDEVAGANVAFSDGQVRFIPAGLPPETLQGLFTGDEKAWKACEEFQTGPPAADQLDQLHRAGGAHSFLRGAALFARNQRDPTPAGCAGGDGTLIFAHRRLWKLSAKISENQCSPVAVRLSRPELRQPLGVGQRQRHEVDRLELAQAAAAGTARSPNDGRRPAGRCRPPAAPARGANCGSSSRPACCGRRSRPAPSASGP